MPEEMEQQEQGGNSKKGLPIKGIIQMVGIPLIVSLVVTVTVLFLLGSNQQTQDKKESQQMATPIQIKAVIIQSGKFQTFMLKGGRDVVVIDSLTVLVGSEQCRAAVADKNDEIMDALNMIFLSKERFELTTPAGLDLLKKQIREAVNEITGFTGENEKFGVINVYLYVKSISSVQ
ncbi:MAG: flagellar basal body-associated protein FliL [Fervidobacterium pennivorans]